MKVAMEAADVASLVKEGKALVASANNPVCSHAVPRLPFGGAVEFDLPGGVAGAALVTEMADRSLCRTKYRWFEKGSR
jgi:hypothetical protein